MSTNLQVMTVAFRRSGVLPAGRQLMSPEITLGLEYLQAGWRQWAVSGMFGQLSRKKKEDAGPYEAAEREWISHKTADAITLPTEITDQGTVRAPKSGAVIVLTNSETGVTTEYIYDPFKADWIDLSTPFDLTGYSPLTGQYDMAIKTMFAVYFADESGVAISPVLAKQYASHKMVFVMRHGEDRSRDVGSYF